MERVTRERLARGILESSRDPDLAKTLIFAIVHRIPASYSRYREIRRLFFHKLVGASRFHVRHEICDLYDR
jgi:hypothetical protein